MQRNDFMKNRKLWINMIVIAVLILAFIGPILYFDYVNTWKLNANYEEYADEFNLVKDYIAEEFPNESDKWVSVSYSSTYGLRIYDPDADEYLQVRDDALVALRVISKEAFPDKDSDLDVIRIHGDRISFCTESGHYALVYSPNKKPTWLNSPDKKDKVKVKKIGEGWYHVTIR